MSYVVYVENCNRTVILKMNKYIALLSGVYKSVNNNHWFFWLVVTGIMIAAKLATTHCRSLITLKETQLTTQKNEW